MEALGLKSPGKGKRILAKYGMNSVDRALCKPGTTEEIR
jgi:hypothetical protein